MGKRDEEKDKACDKKTGWLKNGKKVEGILKKILKGKTKTEENTEQRKRKKCCESRQ